MFTRTSRYRGLPVVVTVDAAGRRISACALRLTGPVAGRFTHTVTETDRLDHLATAYYREPRRWWRICDANPEFLSPQALLGKEPLGTLRYLLKVSATPPVWYALLGAVGALVGVDRVVRDGDWAVLVTANRLEVRPKDIADVLGAYGTVKRVEHIGRVAKPIVIPPDLVG
jgi:hypothetical protein